MLAERMAFILEPAYSRCVSQKFDWDARNRLESGDDYSDTDFENYWQYAHLTDGQEATNIRDSVVDSGCLTGEKEMADG